MDVAEAVAVTRSTVAGLHDPVDPLACRRNAERFGRPRFRHEFADFIGLGTVANSGAAP